MVNKKISELPVVIVGYAHRAIYGEAKAGTAAGGVAITGTASANLIMQYQRKE